MKYLFERFIERVKMCLSYWKLTENLFDFDYSCVLHSELHHLKMLYNGINKYKSHVNSELDLKRILLCIRLLEIHVQDSYSELSIRYVNTKNIKRFFPNLINMNPSSINAYKSRIYEQKAWNLYNIIRTKYLHTWWD